MTVEAIMSRKPMTVKDNDTLGHAIRIMKDQRFKHLPVVNGSGHVVGVVTDRDLKRASPSDATLLEVHELLYLLDQVKIGQIMSHPIVTVEPNTPIAAAARLMAEKRVGCLPVLRGEELVGVLTTTDMLNHLAKLG